jgi:hypothetical protein
MERQQLAYMLEKDEAAFAACRRTVLAGARFWIAEQSQPASTLVSIYDYRDRHTQRQGVPTFGFTHAVDQLRAWQDGLVRIGAVDQDEPPYHFQLFLNEAATALRYLSGGRPGAVVGLADLNDQHTVD